MNDTPKILARGLIHSLTGLSIQMIVSGFLLWLTHVNPDGLARHVLWTSLAGMLVWAHLLVTYVLFKHEAVVAESKSTEDKRDRIRFIHRSYQRFLVPVIELGMAALLIQSSLVGVGLIPSEALAPTKNNLLLIAFYSVTTLSLIVFAVYVNSLMKVKTWHLLKSGRNYTHLMVMMFLSLLTGACCDHFRIIPLPVIIDWGFIAVNTILVTETLLSMVLRLFAPRRPNELPRPAFDFYLLEGLSQPMRIGQTFASMLESILGFDITRTSFGKVVRSLILPTIFLTSVLLLGLSSLVIVKPYEQAILLNLGRLKAQPLHSGLHFKLPWPLASARPYNISQVRSIHVGSHRPARKGGTVYREGVPILWTNMHGLNIDELLICSSPQDKLKTAVKSKESKTEIQKVPSVSLAAADVQVQYVIHDLVSYVRSSAMPEVFLKKVAETIASRVIYRYDIDALFCEARLALVNEIRRSIQEICTKSALGIRVVHVAITAVHPPVDVAGAFEETVAALQERETKIQHARQEAIRYQVETTGSTETFARLSALSDGVDTGRGVDVVNHERLLHECGGEVSQTLAQAESYRFSRENAERGKTERFGEQLRAHTASPKNYRYDQYFSILKKGLAGSRKVVLLGNIDKTIVRMGLGQGMEMDSIPDEMGF